MTDFKNHSILFNLGGGYYGLLFPKEYVDVNAYLQWENEGKPQGRALDHYTQAERTFQEHFRKKYEVLDPDMEIVSITPLPTDLFLDLENAKGKLPLQFIDRR